MPDHLARAIPAFARVRSMAADARRRMEARPRRPQKGNRSMSDLSQSAPKLTVTLRRIVAAAAASALLIAVAAPPVAVAAGRSGVGHVSTVKITRVHQTHLA